MMSQMLILKTKEKNLKVRQRKNSEVLLRIPAGVDTGKFLEEQLKRGKNEGLGPRRIPNPNQIMNPITSPFNPKPNFFNPNSSFSSQKPFYSNQNPSYSIDDGW